MELNKEEMEYLVELLYNTMGVEPCDYSMCDEEMWGDWCEQNCGKVLPIDCWKKLVKIRFQKKENLSLNK